MASRRGRPPLDPTDTSVNLHVRVTTKQFDAICSEASRERVNLSDWVRMTLQARLTRAPVTGKVTPGRE